jgi:hypothetical protein
MIFLCSLSNIFNSSTYADDIVLCIPSWRRLQQPLDILAAEICKIDVIFNVKKTVCLHFASKNCSNTVAHSFPSLKFDCVDRFFVNCFKYLGHIITSDLSDDADIQREIKSMFVRTNLLYTNLQNVQAQLLLFCLNPIAYVCMKMRCGVHIVLINLPNSYCVTISMPSYFLVLIEDIV